MILVGIDFVLRVMVLEKHEINAWRPSDVETIDTINPKGTHPCNLQSVELPVLAKEPTASTDTSTLREMIEMTPRVTKIVIEITKPTDCYVMQEDVQVSWPDHLAAISYLAFTMKALTPFFVTFLNGFISSGLYNTALLLRLNELYGLDSTAAGLVYLAIAIPSAIVSPLSVGLIYCRLVVCKYSRVTLSGWLNGSFWPSTPYLNMLHWLRTGFC